MIKPWLLFVILFVLVLVALELGYLIGRKRETENKTGEAAVQKASGSVTMVKGAILTLLALLLGFTFSMASSRFEARRALLVAEANAIGTTYLRTHFLEAPAGPKMRELLRTYTKVRIEHNDSFYYDPKYEQTRLEGERLQGELWSLISEELRRAQSPLVPVQVAVAMNQMIDMSSAVSASRLNKVPLTVLLLLLLAMFLSSMLVGHSFSRGERRLMIWVVFSLLLTFVVITILDLDQSKWGLITVEQPAMLELLKSMKRDL